ncbi:hypothetical protein AVEN_74045-1 [Araneus ventricosus]|uniref:Uncharacterized protein n=1 Tax=Araneus ventricosus TaxID=182803 RepID=A0A4Y2J479_ARAVE|nr:hypothetical protein AVEN_74045-1 [Araneus ventricosus]
MVSLFATLVRVMPYHMQWKRKESLLLEGLWGVRKFQRNVNICLDIKGSESTDGDLSTVIADCCILCMRRGNSAPSQFQTSNKSPTTQVDRRETDPGHRILQGHRGPFYYITGSNTIHIRVTLRRIFSNRKVMSLVN